MKRHGKTTWGVVCTAAEPTVLTVTFAAHHLAMGADRVWMFLDRPNPEAEQLLRALPGCVVHVCDPSFWAEVHRARRPKVVIRRQLVNADLVYNATDLDWIVHMDCDEFLRSDYPVAEILSTAGPETCFAMFRPAERFLLEGVPQQRIFDGVFRDPDPDPRRKAVPAHDGDFTWRGLTGHCIGKSATRVGQPVLLGIHSPRPMRRTGDWRPGLMELPFARVLHFDGLTPLHWQRKILRAAANKQNFGFLKGMDPFRHLQAVHILGAEAPDRAARELHDRLKILSPEMLARLSAEGRIDSRPFHPEAALAHFGLLDRLDLSAARFDRDIDQMGNGENTAPEPVAQAG